jgi:hypothetical protein
MCFRSAGCGTARQIMQSDTRSTATDHALIRVYDAAGNVIVTHEHKGDFKEC